MSPSQIHDLVNSIWTRSRSEPGFPGVKAVRGPSVRSQEEIPPPRVSSSESREGPAA